MWNACITKAPVQTQTRCLLVCLLVLYKHAVCFLALVAFLIQFYNPLKDIIAILTGCLLAGHSRDRVCLVRQEREAVVRTYGQVHLQSEGTRPGCLSGTVLGTPG